MPLHSRRASQSSARPGCSDPFCLHRSRCTARKKRTRSTHAVSTSGGACTRCARPASGSVARRTPRLWQQPRLQPTEGGTVGAGYSCCRTDRRYRCCRTADAAAAATVVPSDAVVAAAAFAASRAASASLAALTCAYLAEGSIAATLKAFESELAPRE